MLHNRRGVLCRSGYLEFRQYPLRFFNSYELENSQRAVFGLEDIADLNRLCTFAKGEESCVRRRSLHNIPFNRFVIARFHACSTRQVRRETEVLAQMIFQTMNPERRHRSTPLSPKTIWNGNVFCCLLPQSDPALDIFLFPDQCIADRPERALRLDHHQLDSCRERRMVPEHAPESFDERLQH